MGTPDIKPKKYRAKSASINVRDELAMIIERQLEFDNALLTVVRCSVSSNLQGIRAYVSVLPETETASVMKILRREAPGLGAFLAKRIRMKYIPRISFVMDEGEKNFAQVSSIIANIKEVNGAENIQSKTEGTEPDSP